MDGSVAIDALAPFASDPIQHIPHLARPDGESVLGFGVESVSLIMDTVELREVFLGGTSGIYLST